MSALPHERRDHAPGRTNARLPESMEDLAPPAPAPESAQAPTSVAVDLRAAHGEQYPEEERRERRRLFGRRGDDAQPESEDLSWRERRACEKAAREQARQAERAAKEAEHAAKEAEKRAAAEAKEAEKLARQRAKEAERRAAEEAKEAERERKEAEKRAAARAKEAERAAKEAEKRAAAEAKEAEKLAREQARQAERAAKEAEKLARAQRKEAEKRPKVEAREAAKAAKEAEKLARARQKEAEKRARAQQKEAEKRARAERRAAARAEGRGWHERLRSERKPRERGRGRSAKKLVGLEIGASQIAAARVSNNGTPELVEAVRAPLEPGLVVSGEVRDPDALAASLERFFETHKLPKKGIRLGISNNRIGVRVFEIEGVQDAQQLENAIRFRAEEVLPIPLEQAVLDYVVLGEEQREDGTTVHRILLVVAYRDVVDRYLLACRGAGLEVVGIDLEAFALLRALAAPTDGFPGGGALIAVTIGHDRTTIAVSTGRYCDFARVLDWGGWSLNVVIARALDRAPSEVEGIKRRLSLAGEGPIDGLTPEQVANVREAVRGAVASFARELVASLHFYQAQPGALGIGEIQLTGGAAHLPGLPEELGRLIGAPVRLGDPLRRVHVSPDIGHIDQIGSFAVAIGLGIED